MSRSTLFDLRAASYLLCLEVDGSVHLCPNSLRFGEGVVSMVDDIGDDGLKLLSNPSLPILAELNAEKELPKPKEKI